VKDDSGQLYHALEFAAPTLEPLVMYIDTASALIRKQTYVSGAPGQPLIEERYEDYRPVDGVQVAFNVSMLGSGKLIGQRRLSDIKFNGVFDPALFKRPTP